MNSTRLDTFKSAQFVGKPILADIDFFNSLEAIAQFAKENQLRLLVTHSARLQGIPMGGAMAPPASKSNHLVGHAIDLNIIFSGQLYNGTALANGNFDNLPGAIQTFIQAIRQTAPLKWGADANNPVHIDDDLYERDPKLWGKKYTIIQTELIGLTQPNSVLKGRRLLYLTRPYLQGSDVAEVQQALIKQGFYLKADGEFGPLTDAAVTAFQEKQGLTADGIVGPATRKGMGLTT